MGDVFSLRFQYWACAGLLWRLACRVRGRPCRERVTERVVSDYRSEDSRAQIHPQSGANRDTAEADSGFSQRAKI